MKKAPLFFILMTIISAMIFITACEEGTTGLPGDSTSPQEIKRGTVPEKLEVVSRMDTVSSWLGMGDKTTDTFSVDSAPWVIAWEKSPLEGGQATLNIAVLDANRNLVKYTPVSTGDGSGLSYIYETGTFQLAIDANNASWRVEVLK